MIERFKMEERIKRGNFFMRNVVEVIQQRRSVRSYDSKPIDEQLKVQLLAYANNIVSPFNMPIIFQFLDKKSIL